MRPKMDKINVLEIKNISLIGTVWGKKLSLLHHQLSIAETEWAKHYLVNLLLCYLELASRETDPNKHLHRNYTIH